MGATALRHALAKITLETGDIVVMPNAGALAEVDESTLLPAVTVRASHGAAVDRTSAGQPDRAAADRERSPNVPLKIRKQLSSKYLRDPYASLI